MGLCFIGNYGRGECYMLFSHGIMWRNNQRTTFYYHIIIVEPKYRSRPQSDTENQSVNDSEAPTHIYDHRQHTRARTHTHAQSSSPPIRINKINQIALTGKWATENPAASQRFSRTVSLPSRAPQIKFRNNHRFASK